MPRCSGARVVGTDASWSSDGRPLYGRLSGEPLQTAVEYGALAMTTPSDTSMATRAEVLKLAGGGGARVDR